MNTDPAIAGDANDTGLHDLNGAGKAGSYPAFLPLGVPDLYREVPDRLLCLSMLLPVLILLSGLSGLSRAATWESGNTPFFAEDPVEWKTGIELERSIGLATSVRWSGIPLGQRLRAFSQLHRIAVFIDRRVDPTTLVDLQASDVTFEQLLWQLAETCSNDERRLGVARIGDVFYFGPESTAISLPAIVKLIEDQTQSQPLYRNGPWRNRSQLTWPTLASPRDLITTVCESAGATVTNAAELRHDVWPAWNLPGLKIEEQLVLLLAGFEQVYLRSPDGTAIEIISLPSLDSGPQKVAVADDARGIARQLREQYPNLQFSADGRAIEIAGPLAVVYEIRRKLAMEREVVGGEGTTSIYTLDTGDVPRMRGELLASLAQNLEVQLAFEEDVAPVLAETMTFSAKDKRIEEILGAVLAGTDLTWIIEDGQLLIRKR